MWIFHDLDRWPGAAKPAPGSTPKAGLNRRSPTEPEKLESARVVALVAGDDVGWGLAQGYGVGFGDFAGNGITFLLGKPN